MIKIIVLSIKIFQIFKTIVLSIKIFQIINIIDDQRWFVYPVRYFYPKK